MTTDPWTNGILPLLDAVRAPSDDLPFSEVDEAIIKLGHAEAIYRVAVTVFPHLKSLEDRGGGI